MPEIVIIILVIVILLFGAKKLPELARSLGRAKGEFERGKMEVDKEIKEEKAKEAKKEEKTKETKKEEKDFVKAAKELGIDTEGKSEEELKAEIKAKME
ncbi:MAG: twin-arginine translocase TatA/TatE family subunit [Methanomassiliicoccales archaeon]|nr:MAG: twin-arginine translocase TatA/TatE family subunit [Methanomassiliicoccales archaeon]